MGRHARLTHKAIDPAVAPRQQNPIFAAKLI